MKVNSTALSQQDVSASQSGESNWIWNEIDEHLDLKESNYLPRISIVTPSYNQGKFIEETIRSVLLQGYPNLEYIIIDGGSTDNTVEVIKRYEPWITFWVSETDAGQTDAIQKGFNKCTGVIWNWLNSDDVLQPGALHKLALAYQLEPDATLYSGKLEVIGDGPPYLAPACFQNLKELVCIWEQWAVPQPAAFLSREKCLEVNGLNKDLHYGMDYELYLRLAKQPGFKVHNIDAVLASIRRHNDSKTVSQTDGFKRELLQIFDDFSQRYVDLLPRGWEKSRNLFAFISSLEAYKKEISLLTFLKLSMPHRQYIWRYRYFWGTLRQIIISSKLNI